MNASLEKKSKCLAVVYHEQTDIIATDLTSML